MQALLLAGGEGTRLRPLTYTTPKPVLPLAGRPFLTFMLDWAHSHGVDEAILSCGFMSDAVRRVLGDIYDGMRLRYVDLCGVGYHKLDCDYTAGLLSVIPQLFGLPAANVTHDACGSNGAPCCEFDVTWAPGLHEALVSCYPGTFCTALFLLLNQVPEGHRLTVATGGHPLPLCRRADGTIETLGRPGSGARRAARRSACRRR